MTPRGVEDLAEMLAMVRLLEEVGFRDLAACANRTRLAVARRLSREGVDAQLLGLLWEYAKACDDRGTPEALFAYWLASPARTVAKMTEMRRKNVWIARKIEEAQKRDDAAAASMASIANRKNA